MLSLPRLLNAFGVFVVFYALSYTAQAEVYRCVDENEVVTFTDNPNPVTRLKCKGMNLGHTTLEAPHRNVPAPRASTTPSSPKKKSSPPRGGATPPMTFPTVDASTQKNRDSGRKKILMEELNSEKQLLAAAEAAYSQQAATRTGDEAKNYQKYLERLSRYKAAVTAHQKNIEAIQKEIARIK